MYQIVQMYLEQDHLVQNEYFMIGRQKVVIVVFLVYIIVPNVNNILKKIHVSRYCFFFFPQQREMKLVCKALYQGTGHLFFGWTGLTPNLVQWLMAKVGDIGWKEGIGKKKAC